MTVRHEAIARRAEQIDIVIVTKEDIKQISGIKREAYGEAAWILAE